MENIFETKKQINAKIGADTEGATTFELVKAQVAKLGGDTTKVVDIYTGEQQVLEHISAGPAVNIQTTKDVTLTTNGTHTISPDEGYDAIKDVMVDVAVPVKEEVGGVMDITENGHYNQSPPEGKTYGLVTVHVNVAGAPAVFHGSNPKFSDIEGDFPNAEFPDLTKCDRMFNGCTALTSIPLFDTSNATSMNSMFYNCRKLATNIVFNTPVVTKADSTFYQCVEITNIEVNFSNVTTLYDAFYSCTSLQTLQLGSLEKVATLSINEYNHGTFRACSALTDISFSNLGLGFTAATTLDLSDCSKLSDAAIQNVIDGLIKPTASGIKGTVKFSTTVKAKLTNEQKSQITAKNWTLA